MCYFFFSFFAAGKASEQGRGKRRENSEQGRGKRRENSEQGRGKIRENSG